MNEAELHRAILDALGDVAPEADTATLRPDRSLRDQLDIDSMDFLNFVIGLHERTGVDIPERDYPKLATIDACTGYLLAKVGR
jgi:acyl carrier protein